MHSQDDQELDRKWPMVPPVAVQRKVTVKIPERPSSWLLKDGLKAHIYQHHQMRRRLNVQDYFLPGPAHPPKSDNVAKRPPTMLETDQDFPNIYRQPSEGGSKRPAATLYIMYIELFNGLKVEMAHSVASGLIVQWGHHVFHKVFMVYCN